MMRTVSGQPSDTAVYFLSIKKTYDTFEGMIVVEAGVYYQKKPTVRTRDSLGAS